MRISDWSSDVCSSDLAVAADAEHRREILVHRLGYADAVAPLLLQEIADRLDVGQVRARRLFRRRELALIGFIGLDRARRDGAPFRSEEKTSELQSLMPISYAVFFFKNKTPTKHIYT